MGLAQLLAPHAQRRRAAAQALSRARRRAPQTPPPVDTVDASPERVIRAFQAAARADPQWKDPLESLILFADAVEHLDAADQAFRQLIDRDRENPDLLVRHGDFLLGRRKDRVAAVARYREALLWRADDAGARQRIGEVYLEMGIEHFDARQYAVAEERLREAQKWIGDATTPAGDRLRDYLARLAEIRRR
jgi:tetratricopeptide (TPR) repeat protein